jgi:hypothetical protein
VISRVAASTGTTLDSNSGYVVWAPRAPLTPGRPLQPSEATGTSESRRTESIELGDTAGTRASATESSSVAVSGPRSAPQ